MSRAAHYTFCELAVRVNEHYAIFHQPIIGVRVPRDRIRCLEIAAPYYGLTLDDEKSAAWPGSPLVCHCCFVFFLWEGGAISTFTKRERVLAEIKGIGLAVVCGALGALAKSAGDNLDDGEDSGV